MNKIGCGTAISGIIAAVWLGLPATANAVPPLGGGSPASDVINQLQAQGYTVQVQYDNGNPRVALSECTVTSVSGDDGSNSDGQSHSGAESHTVYVHVNCPNY